MIKESTDYVQNTKIKKIQPGWKNAPTRAALYEDYSSAADSQDELKNKLKLWDETREGGPAVKVHGLGKSTARPKVVRKQNEWKYPSLEDPILSAPNLFKVSPATYADVDAARQNDLVLNYQWNTKVSKTKLVGDIVRTAVDEGTVIVKTGWLAETEVKEFEEEQPVYASPEESLQLIQQAVMSGQMSNEQAQAMLELGEPVQVGVKTVTVEREVLTKNHPTYEVCTTANVTVDPTCEGIIEDAMFLIHEFETSRAELKKDEYHKDEDGNESGFYHNIDAIVDTSDEDYDEFASDAANNFEFKDKARKKLRAYEYWGYWDINGDDVLVPIVATWVGKTLIRLEENPFPHKRIPFSIAPYMPIKKSVHGEPDAELLKDNQDSIGRMTRAIHDITTRQAVGQEFIDENFFPSPSQRNSYEKGNTVYYRSGFDPRKAIFRQDIQQIGNTPFDVITWQTNDANELTGTKPFNGPGGAKMGGNKEDRNSMDATAKRELSILRRLSDLLFVDMARMTIAMNQIFLSEEEVIRITDEEFVTIKRDDLEGDFDLSVHVSTPEKDDDTAFKILKLMQTNAANMDTEIANMHYVKIAELWKMDDLAKKVENYKPQPDPIVEAIKQLQLEEQKLKNAIAQKELEDMDSKIYERLSRTDENTNSDSAIKNAKAEQAIATAEKLRSETDILDANFLRLQSGAQRQEEIEDQEYEAQTKAGIEYMKKAAIHAPGKVINEI